MKKFIPFLFPAIALLVVLMLTVRWYRANTGRTEGKIMPFAEGVQIEDLNQTEMQRLSRMVRDINTVKLEGTGEASGEVRYDVVDGKVSFTVTAELPTLTEGKYQVWLKEVNGEKKRRAFVLEETKSGYLGSAAISADTLPFEVVVSKEVRDDDQMELPVLKGIVEKVSEDAK